MRPKPRHRRCLAPWRGLAGAGLALALLAGCGEADPESTTRAGMRIEDVWARPVATTDHGDLHGTGAHEPAHHGAGANGAVYLTLHNPGREAERLVGAESPVARAVEIHLSQVEDGIMRMRPVEEGVTVAAGETVELRPGGLHLMLIGVARPLAPGDRFPLRLHFDKEGTREVETTVRES
jgi:copper(I)-binding protein